MSNEETEPLTRIIFAALRGINGDHFGARSKQLAAREAVFGLVDQLHDKRTTIDIVKTLIEQDGGINLFVQKALWKLLDYAENADHKTKLEIANFVATHTNRRPVAEDLSLFEKRDRLFAELGESPPRPPPSAYTSFTYCGRHP